MKKIMALVLIGLLALGGACMAAQWPAGRSASQPYSHVPEVNLSQTMGYIILTPRDKLPVEHFCDTLEIFLPREDLGAGTGGLLHLYEKIEGQKNPVEVCTVDAANPDSVRIRPMTEEELEGLIWGGGTCVECFLPRSLAFGDRTHQYYVLMDEGFFTAANGSLKSLAITNPEAWAPVINGDYGVSSLFYVDGVLPEPAPEPEEGAAAEDGDAEGASEPSDAEEEEEDVNPFEAFANANGGDGDEGGEAAETAPAAAPSQQKDPEYSSADYVVKPDAGDRVHFDMVIGGEVKAAVPYSENGSVEFDTVEYVESGHVEGTVLVSDDVHWGVVFLNENGDVIDVINVGR